MTIGEIIAKMLSFAVLTVLATGLLLRMAWAVRARSKSELAARRQRIAWRVAGFKAGIRLSDRGPWSLPSP
jgi:hypothetical protein